ncbi:MAG: isopentenyl-diphosphate Delta-isomerase [Proteobacteria bacterium]|nr:isopentenyl-diphosphate Delta-isomerase [Pseudomonadota bacterium]
MTHGAAGATGTTGLPGAGRNAAAARNLVVLIDEHGAATGECDKLEAHRAGLRHLAVSVLLKNAQGQWLLQRRSSHKYHSPNLWANACCGHPMPGEPVVAAARRRLREELGLACALRVLRTHPYRCPVEPGLIEHELVTVLIGDVSGDVIADPAEVAEVRFVDPQALLLEIKRSPETFAAWFCDYLRCFGPELLTWSAPQRPGDPP